MRIAAAASRRRIQSARVEVGAARRLVAEQRVRIAPQVRRGGLDLHLVEPDLQLLRHQHGRAGVDALPHLGVRHDQGDAALRVQPHEGMRIGRAARRRIGGLRPARQLEAEHQPAAEHRDLEQRAARGRGTLQHGAHGWASAAAWMASRIRT
jgi:hypothetical protein